MKLREVIPSILNERSIPITGKTQAGKRIQKLRGINVLVLGEQDPPDVHGIPKELEAYGRGWVDKNTNTIELDGGGQGSRTGHPSSAVNGFYWGADYDKLWKNANGDQIKGVLYVRGRAGTDENFLLKNIETIMGLIFKRLPRN